jgi:hypothetical protein
VVVQIVSNLSSLQARSRLGEATTALGTIFEESTRINHL